MFLEPRNSMIQQFCILCVYIKSNGFVFYMSISKANHQVSFCACIRVCLCVWFSIFYCAYACHHSLNASLKTDQWKGTLKPINMNLEVTVHLHAVTTNPKPPYKYTTVSTLWGMQDNSIISLESFLFHTLLTQDSQSVHLDLEKNEGKAIIWKTGGRNKWFEWVIGKWQQWQNKVP